MSPSGSKEKVRPHWAQESVFRVPDNIYKLGVASVLKGVGYAGLIAA